MGGRDEIHAYHTLISLSESVTFRAFYDMRVLKVNKSGYLLAYNNLVLL